MDIDVMAKLYVDVHRRTTPIRATPRPAGLCGLNSSMYWDGGHAVNYDAPEFIRWVGALTGCTG
jgi:hypothetical protein